MKTSVILGASSGLGKEIAIALAKENPNIHIWLFARRESELIRVQQEILLIGAKVSIHVGDITVEKDLLHLKEAILNSKPNSNPVVDLLVINAGIASGSFFRDLKETGPIREIMNVNLIGPIIATFVFMPLLQSDNQSDILVISSMSGKVGAPTRSLYSASKHGLHGFFDSLRMEENNIRICLFCPGTMDTNFRQSACDGPSVYGSSAGKLDPKLVAVQAIESVRNGRRNVFVPWYYSFAALVNYLFPSLIEMFAKRKYKNKSA